MEERRRRITDEAFNKTKKKKKPCNVRFEDLERRRNCRNCRMAFDNILSKPMVLHCRHVICQLCFDVTQSCPRCASMDKASAGSECRSSTTSAEVKIILQGLEDFEFPKEDADNDPDDLGFEVLPIPLIQNRPSSPTFSRNHITLEGINKDVKTMVRKLIQEKQAEKKKKEDKETEEVFEEDDGTPGQVGWTINNVSIQRALAKPCMSKIFSTGKRGYNFQLEVFLNGTGPGEDWYVSLYFYMCKGSYDWLLQWPCPYVFRVELVKTAHLFELSPTHFFVTAATSEALKKPTEDRGVPEKRDLLIKQTEAFSDKYCNHNAMLIRVTYSNDPTRLQMPASHGNNDSVM